MLTAGSLLFGWFANINYTSIHRYYRDRLMESFMPDIDRALGDETGAAFGADVAKLTDLIDRRDPQPHGPYHIINANVVLTDSSKRVYENRGGDCFILSPFYCGSNATGWCRSEVFCEGKMTLATAVAISGAAVNPNTGVGGTGLTRARLVAFVMALLNLRLGYWAGHPARDKHPGRGPNHFLPGAYAFGNLTGLKGLGFNEHRSFLQLSDGGHFENTGVYEPSHFRTFRPRSGASSRTSVSGSRHWTTPPRTCWCRRRARRRCFPRTPASPRRAIWSAA
jgi:hypothetical protein